MSDDDPLHRRIYRNPPVVEGIARFQWAEASPWSFTTPGQLFEQLRADYKGEPKATAQVSAGLTVEPAEGQAAQTGFELRSGPQRIIYGNDDGTRLVGVSPLDFSVHGLPPYEGWESMTDRLRSALKKAGPVLGQDGSVQLVGLRYINRVVLPTDVVKFDDYLTVTLGYPNGFPDTITGFLDRVEMTYADEDVTLAFTWASTDAAPGTSAVILDLDLYARPSSPVDLDSAFSILDDLKVKEGRAFEALLTDRLRDLFVEID